MKKTLIALAAFAVVGTSFAQVTLTGSAQVASQKNRAGTQQGLAMVDNTFVLTASDDTALGKMTAMFTVENDTNRGAAFTRADQSFVLANPSFVLAVANTRSGGNQGAALVAPVSLADDQWTSTVINREAIDVARIVVPMSSAISLSYAYVEAKDGNVPVAAGIAAVAAGASGGVLPGAVTHVLGGKYSANGLTVAGQFNSSVFSDNLANSLALTNGGRLTRTTSTDLSVVYNAGFATVGFGYDSARRGKPDTDAAATLVGLSVPVTSAASVGFNWGKRDAGSFTQVGAQYDISKRTNVNFSFGTDTQTNTSGSTDQYRLSMATSF